MISSLLRSRNARFALLAGVFSIIPFLTIFGGFFQQDEWLGYTRSILLSGSNPVELLNYAFAPSAGHYIPFTLLMVYFLYRLIGLNYVAFVILSLILHFINVALVYELGRKLFKNSKTAFFCALVFGLLASAYQGTAWVVANLGTHFATVFALLSMIALLNRRVVLSILLLLVSVLFKEVSVGLFVFLPVLVLLDQDYKKQQKRRFIIFIFGSAFIYFVFRLLGLLVASNEGGVAADEAGLLKFVYNLFTLPIKTVVQSFIPPQILRSISFFIASFFRDEITGGDGSPLFEQFAIKRVLEILNIAVFAVVTIFVIKQFLKRKMTLANSKFVLIGFVFVFINSFIYAFAPETSGITAIVDSRNLYFTAVGIALITVGFLQRYFKVGYLILGLFIMFNFLMLLQSLTAFNERGFIRAQILSEIKKSYPDLPKQVIFYIESDTAYYGLPDNEKIPPFQSGFGQTLLAYYWEQEHYPKEFYENRFLWDITSQGYKQVDDVSFGYFRDYDLLKDTITKQNLSPSTVIAYSYSGKDNNLKDITKVTQERLLTNQ